MSRIRLLVMIAFCVGVMAGCRSAPSVQDLSKHLPASIQVSTLQRGSSIAGSRQRTESWFENSTRTYGERADAFEADLKQHGFRTRRNERGVVGDKSISSDGTALLRVALWNGETYVEDLSGVRVLRQHFQTGGTSIVVQVFE